MTASPTLMDIAITVSILNQRKAINILSRFAQVAVKIAIAKE